MSEEMRVFALTQANEAKDIVAQELFSRATSIDVDVVNNEFKNVIFSFESSGATVSAKWNPEDRFNDPEVVYDILLRMIYEAEDHPVTPKAVPSPEWDEPLGFVFSAEDEDE
jgi:hypothetical protein